VSLCTVGLLPLGEFTVKIPEPHATLQGVRILFAIFKIVFLPYFMFSAGGFRIVSDTHVSTREARMIGLPHAEENMMIC